MADENTQEYISSITLPDGTTYLIKDKEAIHVADNITLKHKLTFGAGEADIFDGSADVTVPVYTGTVY